MSRFNSTDRTLGIILKFIIIAAVAVLLAFNYQLFIIKNEFAPAGLNGIATMIQYKTGFSIGFFSLIINVPLCTVAFFFINRDFAVKSMIFCVIYSISYLFLQRIDLSPFQYDAGDKETIFPVILSGVISGLVYGISFRINSSTGGTDIVSKLISHKKPELNFFYVTFTLNALVAIASFFVYAKAGADGKPVYDYQPVCLCIMYCFISSFVGNVIVNNAKKACKFTVITSHADEINQHIFRELKHTSTQIQAIGSYKKSGRQVLICVINPHQRTDFQNILNQYDNTFSFCETVNETYGRFKHIK